MSESLIMGAGCGKCGATWLQDIKEPLNHECPPSEIELRLSKIEKKLELLKSEISSHAIDCHDYFTHSLDDKWEDINK
ncbi:MAG: hypothetical protein KA968_08135 [Chitinophagaceae bacterium]|jgi:formate dehydrogenase assembly factor FdhD|nr:hypothetical protein [Chitinophagaceae bacterium]